MKDHVPAVIFLIAVVMFIALLVAKRFGGNSRVPESAIYAAFDAAKNGDVPVYLKCFGPALRKELKAAMGDAGKDVFRRQLQDRANQITGLALTRGTDAEQVDERVFLVELVFHGRNEKQSYRLRRQWGQWQILEIGAATSVRMPIPYGTPVIPEGINTEGIDRSIDGGTDKRQQDGR